jgi:hypothetical protein
LFREELKKHFNINALEDEWSHNINWANIPFSHANPFSLKALIEYIK